MSKRKRKNTIKHKSTNNPHATITKHVGINSDIVQENNAADEKPWSKSKKKRMRKLLGDKDDDNLTTTRNNGHFTSHPNSKPEPKPKPKKKSSRSDTNCNKSSNDDQLVSSIHKSPQQSIPVRDEVKEDIVLMMGNKTKPKSTLQQVFYARLAGSRFRELNEELYTTISSSAHQRFKDNPELFDQYHQGFRTQVKSWPINPVDGILRWLISHQKKRASGSGAKRRKGARPPNSSGVQLKVADFGCGDAMLGQKLLDHQQNGTKSRKSKIPPPNKGKVMNSSNIIDTNTTPFSVHSFDLVSIGNPLITPCDMANVPLPDSTIDIGIFSLALMGTNIADFIREAHRVLTPGGILKIAEVRSRFETTSHTTIPGTDDDPEGGRQRTFDQSLLQDFLRVMRELGFYCTEKDRSNRMFFLLEFKKTGAVPCREARFTAKPCLYKRR